MIPDLLLEKGDKAIIVEVKRPSNHWDRRVREGIEQLKRYLAATDLTQGILFIPAIDPTSKITLRNRTFVLSDKTRQIAVVSPGR